MRIDIISIFPEIFDALNFGVISRAISKRIISIHHWNPRKFSNNEHGFIDDKPYGGGPGMVMCYEPLLNTLEKIKSDTQFEKRKIVCLSPSGNPFEHQTAQSNSHLDQLIIICGRYEGIDQRFIDNCVDEIWSLGNFVISGGELAACCIIDAITRLIPGTLGNPDSLTSESFTNDEYDYPVYTRPAIIDGHEVPKVLLEGNHSEIELWRKQNRKTKED
tara:strand:- start:6099 stop:6752 length:654 start_codon:yes stop_codon:yes gene_type:complete